jgi:hypothetical protein
MSMTMPMPMPVLRVCVEVVHVTCVEVVRKAQAFAESLYTCDVPATRRHDYIAKVTRENES